MSLVIICLITVSPLSLMSTYRLFLLPIHYLSPTEWQWRPSGQLGNSYKSSSVLPTTLATYFLYIVYLISIDLESSRSFNSSHCKAYSYGPGSHHLLTNQSTTSFKKSILLPPLQVFWASSGYLSCTRDYLQISNERTIDADGRSNPTDERTDESNQSFGTLK